MDEQTKTGKNRNHHQDLCFNVVLQVNQSINQSNWLLLKITKKNEDLHVIQSQLRCVRIFVSYVESISSTLGLMQGVSISFLLTNSFQM